MHPTFGYTWQDVLDIQMKALQDNDQPYHDHGIEVCYRFAAFDPWSRSTYFGRSMDLGQFERFRRIFSSPYYRPLLGWVSRTDLSTIADGEDADRVVTRMAVEGRGGEGGTFQVTLVRRVGGRDDGYWYVDSWLRDDGDWNLGDNMIL